MAAAHGMQPVVCLCKHLMTCSEQAHLCCAQLYTERSLQFMENVIRISGIGKGCDTQGFLPDGAACTRLWSCAQSLPCQ